MNVYIMMGECLLPYVGLIVLNECHYYSMNVYIKLCEYLLYYLNVIIIVCMSLFYYMNVYIMLCKSLLYNVDIIELFNIVMCEY